jgi:hypothetical protein
VERNVFHLAYFGLGTRLLDYQGHRIQHRRLSRLTLQHPEPVKDALDVRCLRQLDVRRLPLDLDTQKVLGPRSFPVYIFDSCFLTLNIVFMDSVRTRMTST